jgi:hypothetical protein
VILISVIAGSFFGVLYIQIYWRLGIWQALGGIAIFVATFPAAFVAWRMTQRGRPDVAAYMLIGGLAMAFCYGELAWEGLTWYLLVSVILNILLIDSSTLPHKPGVWVTAAVPLSASIAGCRRYRRS